MPCQGKAGHHVGHNEEALAVQLTHVLHRVGRIEQRQHGVGVGVIDEGCRDDGVQDSLDRRGRCAGVGHGGAHGVDHGSIAEGR